MLDGCWASVASQLIVSVLPALQSPDNTVAAVIVGGLFGSSQVNTPPSAIEEQAPSVSQTLPK